MNLFEVFLAAKAWASVAGAEHHAPDISGIIFPLLNFLIYVGVIYYYALPLVRRFLRSRRAEVVATITAVETRKQRAKAVLEDYTHRLANLDQEGQSIQELLKTEGEREKARVISEAEVMATKIKSDAEFLAEQEIKIAKQQVLEEMAERAKVLAADLVRRHISPADQARLVEEFIQQVGQVR
ncbi:MAG: hypothetical protein GEU77_05385 [Deltaproteobacteria bacterium]|nr:hypothetical protein [Deltaproteobacteria bacterium]